MGGERENRKGGEENKCGVLTIATQTQRNKDQLTQ